MSFSGSSKSHNKLILTPMRHFQPRDEIVLEHGCYAVHRAGVGEPPNHRDNGEIGDDYGITLGFGENNRVGVEMVGPFGICFLSGNIKNWNRARATTMRLKRYSYNKMSILTKVGRESKSLLTNQHVEGINRSIAKNLVPVNFIIGFVWNFEIFTGLGNVYFVAFH